MFQIHNFSNLIHNNIDSMEENGMSTKLKVKDENIYFQQTDKYKTILIGMFLFTPFQKKHLAERSIISALMTKSNLEYPNEQDFQIYRQELYDMGIQVGISRVGQTSVFTLYINIVNPKYLTENIDLLEKAVDLIQTSLLKVDFDESKIEKEKRLLIQDLEGIYNNKAQYANQQFVKIMFENEMLSIRSTGEIEDIKKVSTKTLKTAHKEMLKFPRLFYVAGDVCEEEIKKAFEKLDLPKTSGSLEELSFLDDETKTITEVKRVTETQNISQSILCIGYRSQVRLDNPLYLGMHLLNGMLGQFFHSTLFQIIREKHSMAYYVGSDYNARKGNFAIIAAIDQQQYDKVVSLVTEIMEDYRNKRISEEILELTKKAYISKMQKFEDSQLAMIPNIYSEISGIEILTLEEKIERIQKVTMDEVVQAANQLTLDTIYFLKGEHYEKGE